MVLLFSKTGILDNKVDWPTFLFPPSTLPHPKKKKKTTLIINGKKKIENHVKYFMDSAVGIPDWAGRISCSAGNCVKCSDLNISLGPK